MRRTLILGVVLLLAGTTASADELNAYEWSAVAPFVVIGKSLGETGPYIDFHVNRVLRGDLQADSMIRLDVKRANRERSRLANPVRLRMEEEVEYVLLLEPGSSHKAVKGDIYWLARGIRGARELPVETTDAFIDALVRFIEIQDLKDDRRIWARLEAMLDEINPLMVRTSLEQHRKFRRGSPDLIESLRPLLDHPQPEIRLGSAHLLGQILTRHSDVEIPQEEAVRTELVARARRDPTVEVRVAATEALDGFPDDKVQPILEEIAEQDPDQSVRYVAEKILLSRRRAGPSSRGAASR